MECMFDINSMKHLSCYLDLEIIYEIIIRYVFGDFMSLKFWLVNFNGW